MNTYARLVYRNLRANLDKVSLFFELIFPLFFIFVEGIAQNSITVPIDVGGGKFVNYSQFLAAGAVTLTVINGGTSAGTQLWFDRKNGMFEQILMAPFTRAQYILSIILATLIIGIAGSLLIFAIALPVLGIGYSLSFQAVVLVGLALFFGTIFFGGYAIALSVILKSSESFQIISTFAFFVILFTSSVFFPAQKAPVIIKMVSLLNPLTYTTDMFRSGAFNSITSFTYIEATVLAVESLAMFIVAVLAFRRIRV